MTKYTKSESEFSYTGQYPGLTEFKKPWEEGIEVVQGKGALSTNETPLQSGGFSKCSAMLLKNERNKNSALFHIEDIDLNRTQLKIVGEFIKDYVSSLKIDPKEKDALFAAFDHVCNYEDPSRYGAMEREDIQKRMEKLNRAGAVKACFVEGTRGRRLKDRIFKSVLNYLGVRVEADILVDTGDYHWALVYVPKEKKIYVNAKSQKKVLTFTF